MCTLQISMSHLWFEVLELKKKGFLEQLTVTSNASRKFSYIINPFLFYWWYSSNTIHFFGTETDCENFNTIFTVILHLTHLNVNVFFFWMWPWSRTTFEWWVHVLFIERKTDISSLGQFTFYPAAHQSYLNDEHFEDPYRVAKWQDSNPHMHPTHHTRAHRYTMASHKDTDYLGARWTE